MDIEIIGKQFKECNNNMYCLEITLSDYPDPIWEQSFKEALRTEPFISMRSSGAPIVNMLSFQGNTIITPPFAEYAKTDLPEFLNELRNFIKIANKIYNAKVERIRQQEKQEAQEKQDKAKKLDELNNWLNDK